MSKKQALGRGLSALLPDIDAFEQHDEGEKIVNISVTQIKPNPYQPRRIFDAEKLAELAQSIREHGVMQPVIVSEADDETYLLVAGERRWQAAQSAGLQELPCIVRKLSDRDLAELSLIENLQREDLSPLEEADAFRTLMDSYGYTQEDMAKRLGKSRPYVANTLRLLSLAAHERKLLADGKISAGHARCVLSLSSQAQRTQLISAILRDGLAAHTGAVLATGGGAILRQENRRMLRQNGRLFWIDRPLEKLIPTGDRPLSGSEELLARRYLERYEIYREAADLRINDPKTAEEAAERIGKDYENR